MPEFVFTGVAFVSGVKIIVKAETLGEAVGIVARDEGYKVELEPCTIEYSWADLNSGTEIEVAGSVS